MRVLIVHYRYFISGGPERYLFNVKEALEKRGHVVIPFSIKNSKNVDGEFNDFFVENIGNSDEVFIDKYKKSIKTYLDLLGREFYSFKVKHKLKKLIEVSKPDICYLLVYKRALSPSVIDICKQFDIPVINRISDYNTVCGNGSLYRDGTFCDKCIISERNCVKYNCVKGNKIFSLMRFLSIKLHKLLRFNKKIDQYICTNEFMVEMMKKYGYSSNKISMIPTFFKENEALKQIDKRNKINDDIIKMLFIGNIDESKGIYDLLDALKNLKDLKFNNFHLDVVGGIREEEIIKTNQLILDYDLTNHVTLSPFVKSEDVFNYYLNNNITILPARWVENLPNTLIESLYFNRPVVVPKFGSFIYTTNEMVSFRYKALSSDSLCEVLKNILEHPDLILEKSANCSNYFQKYYSEEQHLNELLSIFNSFIKEVK